MALFAVFLIPIAGWFVWIAAQAVENGRVSYRALTFRRDRQPIMFWMITAFYAGLAPAALVMGVMVSVAAVWPRIV